MNFPQLTKYKTKGEFIFKQGDKLSNHCKGVPHAAGIYTFRTIKGEIETLVYVGASGTMKQNGKFVTQLMKKRLQNMQSPKVRRQVFFESAMEKGKLDGIRVNWYVTFDEEHQDLPMYIEALLLQKYFDSYKILPIWNKKV